MYSFKVFHRALYTYYGTLKNDYVIVEQLPSFCLLRVFPPDGLFQFAVEIFKFEEERTVPIYLTELPLKMDSIHSVASVCVVQVLFNVKIMLLLRV